MKGGETSSAPKTLEIIRQQIRLTAIVLKPDPVIDPVKWSGHGLDGLTRVKPGQPKKKSEKPYNFSNQ